MAKNEPNKPDDIKTEPGKEQATPDTGPVEAGGKPAHGEVVVPFDKINEIVSDKKAAAKAAEQAAPDKTEPETPAKRRGGRPPKADKPANAGKLTGRVLAKVFAAAVGKIKKEHQKAQTPQGKQSVKKLMNHGVSTSSLPLDGETRLFDRVARKYNVDYAFYKTGPNKHLLFFKAGQADAITACFSEYTGLVMKQARNKRPSVLEQIKQFAKRERTRPQEPERKREAVRDER